MMRVFFQRPRGALFTCAVLLTSIAASASASSISARASPFQVCLDGRYETWVNARAELVANEDPRASDIDDPAVAKWAMETLAVCRAQADGADRASEEGFMKRLAQWREHIYGRVQSIRELARPD